MNSSTLRKSSGAALVAATLLAGATCVQAQSAKPADSASMVKPPPATSDAPGAGGARPSNPDNMPTKRPALPANSDRMLHNNPASDAIAK